MTISLHLIPQFQPNDVLECIEAKHVGEWCVVNYEDEGYPGIITEVQEKIVKVKCMHRNGINKFFWPSPREDITWYADRQIVCLIPEPQVL
uniref:Uncharacterized protein n=1 Tax=Anguilla anguilla TaxID=7936 RepID=A0A0E9P581_ANGAN